jgi:hypothetical protein
MKTLASSEGKHIAASLVPSAFALRASAEPALLAMEKRGPADGMGEILGLDSGG